MKYQPRVFRLKAGERKTVYATVLRSDSGLAEVEATADGWGDLDTIIDCGFSPKLMTNITEPIQSGTVKSFSMESTDSQGNPISLDSPVTLRLHSSNVLIRSQGNADWSDSATLAIESGASLSSVADVRAQAWANDAAAISVTVMAGDDPSVPSDGGFHLRRILHRRCEAQRQWSLGRGGGGRW